MTGRVVSSATPFPEQAVRSTQAVARIRVLVRLPALQSPSTLPGIVTGSVVVSAEIGPKSRGRPMIGTVWY